MIDQRQHQADAASMRTQEFSVRHLPCGGEIGMKAVSLVLDIDLQAVAVQRSASDLNAK